MDSIVLTEKQEQGLRIAIERYKNKEPYTVIAGFAGTGKSTLVSRIIQALGLEPHEVCFVAYTGKAALVLKNKGNLNAKTAHRLLYKHIPKGDGTYIRQIIPVLPPYKVIVVDEVSMLPRDMWELLLSHKIYVLALGDPGQLPPVVAERDNHVLDHPHIFLDQVMRQAQDSGIIRLTMDIREHKPLQYMKSDDVQIVSKSEYLAHPGMIKWADQILCAKNVTRTEIIQKYRKEVMGIEGFTPVVGDKLICLRNCWDEPNLIGDCLVNGMIGTLTDFELNKYENRFYSPSYFGGFLPDYAEEGEEFLYSFYHLRMDPCIFETGEKMMKTPQDYRRIPDKYRPFEFDYAYAITCHKAQGSEYNKVLVFEEFMKGDNQESHARWLYTAATRAKSKLIIVKA